MSNSQCLPIPIPTTHQNTSKLEENWPQNFFVRPKSMGLTWLLCFPMPIKKLSGLISPCQWMKLREWIYSIQAIWLKMNKDIRWEDEWTSWSAGRRTVFRLNLRIWPSKRNWNYLNYWSKMMPMERIWSSHPGNSFKLNIYFQFQHKVYLYTYENLSFQYTTL